MRALIRTAIGPLVLLALLSAAGCGSRDPLAGLKADYPDADEYRTWRSYVLIRYPEGGEEPSVILKRDQAGWRELAYCYDGFRNIYEVMTWIPELDESGVEALDVRSR